MGEEPGGNTQLLLDTHDIVSLAILHDDNLTVLHELTVLHILGCDAADSGGHVTIDQFPCDGLDAKLPGCVLCSVLEEDALEVVIYVAFCIMGINYTYLRPSVFTLSRPDAPLDGETIEGMFYKLTF